MKLNPRLASTVVMLALGALPALARAQTLPSYASPEEHVDGTIASVDGQYQIHVHDDRGFADNVTLRDGTIINPTGLKLSPGQRVHIIGHADGGTFVAIEIDTPYSIDPPADESAPYAADDGAYPYTAYGYPYYGYPYYGYPYWPFYGGLGLGFYFGGGGHFHDFHGGYYRGGGGYYHGGGVGGYAHPSGGGFSRGGGFARGGGFSRGGGGGRR